MVTFMSSEINDPNLVHFSQALVVFLYSFGRGF